MLYEILAKAELTVDFAAFLIRMLVTLPGRILTGEADAGDDPVDQNLHGVLRPLAGAITTGNDNVIGAFLNPFQTLFALRSVIWLIFDAVKFVATQAHGMYADPRFALWGGMTAVDHATSVIRRTAPRLHVVPLAGHVEQLGSALPIRRRSPTPGRMSTSHPRAWRTVGGRATGQASTPANRSLSPAPSTSPGPAEAETAEMPPRRPRHPAEKEHSAPWRQSVFRRVLALQGELERLKHDGRHDESRVRTVEVLLDAAEDAATADVGVAKWWWGTEVERAWAALREAEERTVYLLPDGDIGARAAAVLAYGRRHLAGDDPRLMLLDRLRSATVAGGDPPLAPLRACIAEVLRAHTTLPTAINNRPATFGTGFSSPQRSAGCSRSSLPLPNGCFPK
ncbi:DUF4682 domain-containing protein [Mycolicibacterium psychrotolerans]|uniref:DUF4682 domain-containing protein n=1 Tax=Mycolicibacterium psychrotolerans TaxID=216929 RepID=UPI001FE47BE1|nr:DUF4682 domain-containing protein [Mycolicibacterium psychrotolerans]